MRVQHRSVFFLLFLFLAPHLLPLAAQSATNPVPFINNPLVPSTVTPGGPAFTLTVNGTGFVSGAVASWNGSARTTTFVSSSQLTVNITASDIAKAGTANVAVANPGGIASLPASFDITNSVSSVGFASTYTSTLGSCFDSGLVAVTGDFNGDGKLDLVSFNRCSGAGEIIVMLGNGDGTFRNLTPISIPGVNRITSMVAADFNNDGKSDLFGTAEFNAGSTFCCTVLPFVLLGNGDGTFQPPMVFSNLGHFNPGSLAVGDFNRDGRLDVAVTTPCSYGSSCGAGGWISILLGNGDGTFQTAIVYSLPPPCSNCFGAQPSGLAIGDFNRDGKLDLAVSDGQYFILLGNGDGTFQVSQPLGVAGGPVLAAADLNGDGKLDLVATSQPNSVIVMLGNGDGTFGAGKSFTAPPSSQEEQLLILGDFNGDGKLDLVLNQASAFSLLLGNGDGTFQPATSFNFSLGLAPPMNVGDFNQDGKLDLAVTGGTSTSAILLQTTVLLPIGPVDFGSQNDGTTSTVQNVALTNLASSALTLNSVVLNGTNSGDFAILSNSCGTTLPAGASCNVGLTFTPVAKGARSASLSFTDGAPASPQLVVLTGTGVGTAPPAVSLAPTSLTFPAQLVSTSSSQMTVTVTNTGDLTLTVNGIVFQGANPGDFSQTNNCSSSLAGGANCNINVTFTPGASGSRSVTMQIIDNAANSPQTVAVSGTGSTPTLGLVVPSGSSSSATVQAGGPASYTLAIGGGGMNGTASLVCTGAPMGAVCSVPSTISVASATASNFTTSVTTTSRTLSALRLIENHPGFWAWAVFFLGIAILPRARRRKRALLRFAWLIPLAVSLCACGGGGGSSTNPNGTPAGTYTLTVTATSGSTNQAVNLTLIVQ